MEGLGERMTAFGRTVMGDALFDTPMAELSPLAVAGVLFGLAVAVGVVVHALGALFGGRKPKVYSPGVPFLGTLMGFAKNPIDVIRAGHAKHGNVFSIRLLHKKMTFLVGPEVSSHFFKGKETDISQKEVYEFNVPVFGPGVVYDVDMETRVQQFQFFAESLKPAKMKTYVGMMVREAEDFFAKWGDEGTVDLRDEFSRLIILTASRCLMGREIREQLFDKVASLYHDLDDGMQPISVLFPYLPIEAHRKRDAARKEMGRLFAGVIKQRRASNANEPDVLQTFIDAEYKNGKPMEDEQITGMLIAVLFAGQHTSSITSTWTGLKVLEQKAKWWPRLEGEQKRLIAEHGATLDYDVVNKMDNLHWCIQEALRMYPPLIMLMRYVKTPFTVDASPPHGPGGPSGSSRRVTIDKGSIIATSPTYAHYLDHVFKDPGAYDPDRFGPGRQEDKQKDKPFSHIGFGGGRRACMGERFAYLQIKSIWAVLIRDFDFTLESPVPEPDFASMICGPKPGGMVRFKRRKVPLTAA